MVDHVAAYRGIRDRVTELTATMDSSAADRVAPGTPEWRIKDLVAHLTGVAADVMQGNVEGAGTDAWTEAQVAARRDRSLGDILDEWNSASDEFDAFLPAVPESPRSQLIFDAMTHEFDVRGALGVSRHFGDDATTIGFGWGADIVAMMRVGAGAGALCLRTEFGDQIVGTGEVTATVAADRFELYRAMTGRRSVSQIEAFSWEGDVAVAHLSFLRPRSTDLVE